VFGNRQDSYNLYKVTNYADSEIYLF